MGGQKETEPVLKARLTSYEIRIMSRLEIKITLVFKSVRIPLFFRFKDRAYY
ncbi:hypothetical protein Niako_5268 [Niastella koreensis GR20-10]|uniref:Uncharacterized protein n=1 Tax=Niastella koreensis (strain DSM 17620 / KACC 11465 / NBRC 106392 / GR20-10) TaxID=700598 RepID=G8TDQ5_NIAKG|nr:hypothetical protein Niako_5268 [Niastella koreensis GR20-10]